MLNDFLEDIQQPKIERVCHVYWIEIWLSDDLEDLNEFRKNSFFSEREASAFIQALVAASYGEQNFVAAKSWTEFVQKLLKGEHIEVANQELATPSMDWILKKK